MSGLLNMNSGSELMLSKDDDIRPICRICHDSEEESSESLISPCNCEGTMKFVHASCMDKWRLLNLHVPDLRNKCQLCKTDFRLKENSRFSRHKIWMLVISNKGIYSIIVKFIAALFVVPASFGALMVSTLLRRDGVYLSTNSAVTNKVWKKKVFGYVVRASLLADINRIIEGAAPHEVSRIACFIYGLSKLGSFGCTIWLFGDGMADFIPIYYVNAMGERRPSPFMAILKAVVEFYAVPFCLRTPESLTRLPFFLATVGLGLVCIINGIEKKLRFFFFKLVPYCRHLELGMLANQ